MKYLLVLLMLLTCNSCYSDEQKQSCINTLRKKSVENISSKEVICCLKDSIVAWSNMEVFRYHNYFDDENWIFEDLVLFTKDSSRAYSWIYQIPKDTNSFFQNIKLFVAERTKGKWFFYLEGMPTIAFSREENYNKPYTKEQLQQEMDNDLMKHLDVKNCLIINQDKIINDFFQGTWGLIDMEKKMWDNYYKEKAKKK